ncbi:hypothetical protein GE107_16005 [Cohnella sp. CFH 77786]|uniref:hypothetical protein n=1 Tax=Cohnella sp. CFH 77786 TaxID=2662265 RepID=UPI001C60D773|nr:hypothetical protein [Cohnella sp. CFH 77786]MBW5447562.1 hypothetical protein [Cohnella sp. CFH 77786]
MEDNKTQMFKNINQSATQYAQKAIENVSESPMDATQNLVNQAMKKRLNEENNQM